MVPKDQMVNQVSQDHKDHQERLELSEPQVAKVMLEHQVPQELLEMPV